MTRLIKITQATSRYPERDVLVLMLGHYCGMRITEISRLTVADLMHASGKLRSEISMREAMTKGCRQARTEVVLMIFDYFLLRTCLRSPEDQSQECQVEELKAGVEQSLTVLPQPPVLLQPGKAALDDPALGHYLECVQFAALGDLYRDVLAQDVAHTLREGLAHVAGVCQQALYSRQREDLQRWSACSAPLRSVTSAVVTATA